jgi:hypothetical protein
MDNQEYAIRLNTHTGMLVLWSSKSYNFQGTYEQCVEAYKKAQRHNKLWGWWSGLSPFLNLMAMNKNKKSLAELEALHAPNPATPPPTSPVSPA